MNQEFQRNQLPKTSRIVASHHVQRVMFILKASTWAVIDAARKPLNLTASQFIEMLVSKATR